MDGAPILVAVACSAGGLDAVAELLAALPAECAAAFILAHPVDPVGKRLPLETINQRTILPVLRAQDELLTIPRHVYITTANTTLTVTGGRIRVTREAGADHHPGDILFTSLAKERGPGAIGVVLSGEGSDGARGIRAIRQSGGVTIVQYPGSARFPSMPINAIETGCVDSVLRPDEIAHALALLCGHRFSASLASVGAECGPPLLLRPELELRPAIAPAAS